MTIDQLKEHVMTSQQHYYNKLQVIELINKLNNEGKRQGMRDSRTGDGVYYKIRPLTKNLHITRWKKAE